MVNTEALVHFDSKAVRLQVELEAHYMNAQVHVDYIPQEHTFRVDLDGRIMHVSAQGWLFEAVKEVSAQL